MNNHLKFRFIFTLAFLALCTAPSVAQTASKEDPSSLLEGKPTAARATTRFTNTPQTPNPLDALRNARTIYVKSSSLLVGVSVIEEKLQRRREFQQMGLMITRDPNEADLILELHHDVLTMYVYTALDPRTDFVVASGKLSSLGGTVAGKVAERFLKQMLRARLNQPT